MKRLHGAAFWVGPAAVALTVTGNLHPQQGGDHAMHITTQERIEAEAWWPGKSSFPLDAYAGSSSCTRCHTQESAGRPSSMRLAAVPGSVASFFRDTAPLTISVPPLAYALVGSREGIDYTVSNGAHKISQRLDWVMGAGDLGRTFLYQKEGRWYQSEISYYTRPASLGITTGFVGATGPGLTAALGQALSPQDARSCFGCHTVHATTSAGLNPLHAEPGVGCEGCHGPALAHERQNREQVSGVPVNFSVFNPAKLSPADSIDFCGSCHRTFADAMLSTGPGASTSTVRFQPYRLEESRCWRATQSERLTCVACHNPHEPLNKDLISYDKHCLQCHSESVMKADTTHSAKACPKALSQCVSCHMPKVAVASMHGDFTDHFIRVVRAEDGFPK